MAGAARDSGRRHGQLQRDRAPCRLAPSGTSRCRRVRGKHAGGGYSVPSRGAQRRRPVRLPLGRGTQARPAGSRGQGMNAVAAAVDIDARLRVVDWGAIAGELDAYGCAMLDALLSPQECRALARLYPHDALFRSRVVMGRHGFGRGEYKYFSYPLPDAVASLRDTIYPRLVPIANRWNAAMGSEVRYPDTHAAFLQRCHAAGQSRPTPLLLQYGAGDYNCLHQDLYGEHVFPLQVAVLLSCPGRDFTGGEFVLTEQRPRMQSRAEVIPLQQGDGVVFAVH